jgi:polysaccharide export outer membrane protein
MSHTSLITPLVAAALAAALAAPATADDPPVRTAPGSPVADEYRLGAGDKLRIEVWKDAQLSQSLQIRPDGKITLPLVGDLDAINRTPVELDEQITKSLQDYMTNPVVTVIVVEALSSQVFVTGQVAKSGPIQIYGPTTIVQAIAMAGGMTDWANRRDVRVLRPGPTGTQTLRVNYQEAINGEGKPVYLRAGDTVVVR